MKNFFRSIIPFISRIFPKRDFANVSFWKHREGKYLYLVMSDIHIKDEKTFIELFPKAKRISETEFGAIGYFFPEIPMITIADDNIHAMIEEQKQNPHAKEHEGEYADDEHEESEDKNINEK